MRPPPAELDDLLGMVERRRQELRHEIHALGRRIYAEAPKAFRKRWRRYVRAAPVPAHAS
jgi:hypothetical protein